MYTPGTMSEFYNIKELSDGKFPLSFKHVDLYHQEDPFLLEKLRCGRYQKGSFRGAWNTIKL